MEKSDHIDTAIFSTEQRQALLANSDKTTHAAHKKAFEAEFADWIDAQNARVDTHGIPGADLRPW